MLTINFLVFGFYLICSNYSPSSISIEIIPFLPGRPLKAWLVIWLEEESSLLLLEEESLWLE